MSAAPREEVGSYLLGEMDKEAAAAFERQMAAEPELRAEVERLRPVVTRLEELPEAAWDAPEPPPLSLPEAEAPAASPAASPGAGTRRRFGALTLRPAPAAGLAALLLAIGVAAGALLGGGDSGSNGPSTELALSRIDDGPAGARGQVLVSDGNSATVDVSGLKPTGSSRFYELWLLDEDGRMIALGSFRVGEDGHAGIDLPIPVSPQRYRYFDVSLQEDNGDPAHSGVSVLRGPTSS